MHCDSCPEIVKDRPPGTIASEVHILDLGCFLFFLLLCGFGFHVHVCLLTIIMHVVNWLCVIRCTVTPALRC